MKMTKNHIMTRAMVIAQPIRAMALLSLRARAMAKVDVVRAVLGKMKEYHVIAKSILPLRAHDQ